MPDGPDTQRKSTLRDVAMEAGVSVATVSRVLNNSTLVTKSTRDRVGAAIEALNFAPSAVARSLSAGKTRTVGTLVPTIDHSIFARYLNSLEDELSKRGYGLVVAVTGGSLDVEAQKARDLLSLGVDGLIVSGVERSLAFDDAVRRFGVPVIITSYFDATAPYPTIGYDNAAIARMAVEFLSGKGHRDIAVIHGSLAESDRTRARVAGARSPSAAKIRTFEAPVSVAGGDSAMGEISLTDGPSAVLCLSDVQALGALFNAQRRGIAIPGDISIMGFDNLEWSAISTPGITTIDLPAVDMGISAANAMVDRLTAGQPADPTALPARIIERGSVKDLAHRG